MQEGRDQMGFHCTYGLHVEIVDDGYLVLAPARTELLHLTGAESDAFALARSGCNTVPDELTGTMAGLIELGIVETDTWTRRRVLQLGGAAAAAAVAVIALPEVAAAGSPPGGGTSTSTTTTTLPTAIARDLYIADTGNGRVVKIDAATGTQSDVPNNADTPYAVAVGGDGNIYVADYANYRVIKIAADTGDQTYLFTASDQPNGVAVDGDGIVYIACPGSGVLKQAGLGNWTSVGTGLSGPRGVAVG